MPTIFLDPSSFPSWFKQVQGADMLICDTVHPRAGYWPYSGLLFTHFFLVSGRTEVLKEVGRAKCGTAGHCYPSNFSLTEVVSGIVVVI